MAVDHRAELKSIQTFPSLVRYLREELDWPIDSDDFEELTFEYTPEELGIERASAAKIQEIKRLRPLSPNQPWGIFFVKFEPKKFPVVALRRILSRVALKKRASANSADRAAWAADDLLFVSNFGQGERRQISFAHFSYDGRKDDLPTLKVLGWDNRDTPLHLDHADELLRERLAWPHNTDDAEAWRLTWRSAFTLRHKEVIETSKTLAVRLAELARAIRDRINTTLTIETEAGELTKLMKAFRQALVHDLDADGFADMYAQTIAYGLLSARIADPKAKTADDFAEHMRTNPFLKELMETFLHVGGQKGNKGRNSGLDFDELGVNEVVELLDDANMDAVVRDFGDRNPQEDPVIHFYELFLREYDAKQKANRGVFYTPRPAVSYIVRSVHELLQTEFGLADGLADTATWGEMAQRHPGLSIPDGVKPTDRFVTILDPATGTGTFLVEAIEVIYRTLVEKWKLEAHGPKKILDLWNDYVPNHLLPRLHGYELLMAPYAIAHLKLGLKLHETGYHFESNERARIYLTNALEPAQDSSAQFEFGIPALAHEAKAVNHVKRHQLFTIVIGNPPYAGFSSNMTAHAQHLVDAYKIVDGEALNERKLWLQDDYVKFIRLAQVTVERAQTGILGYITNHGYLDNPTFRGMRQSLLGTFQGLRTLDLHGNANKKEQPPHGSEDKNVFDIRQGVAITIASRGDFKSCVEHSELWGAREAKYEWLGAHHAGDTAFAEITPDSPFYFLEPQSVDWRAEYENGWKINQVMPVNSAGFITARDHFVVALDGSELLARIADFASRKFSDAQIRAKYFAGGGSDKYPDGDTRGWKVPEARKRVQKDGRWRKRVRRCLYRPFDFRSIYWAEWMVDWPRPEVMGHMFGDGALALSTTRSVEIGRYEHVFCSALPLGHHTVSIKEVNYMFPLYLLPDQQGSQHSLELQFERVPNFAPDFLKALATSCGVPQNGAFGFPEGLSPESVFSYIYAVLHSPGYRSRYAEFLKSDFPRLPLISSLGLFGELARRGDELVAFHLVEAPAQRALSARFDKVANEWRYEAAKRQRLPVRLSFNGPQKPVVGKVGWSDDTVWIDAAKPKKGAANAKATGTVGFRGVPEDVWSFSIGGYQVCEKWLKDRGSRKGEVGRILTAEDIAHYHRIVVAVHETIRLMREIDEVIEAHGGWPTAFQPERTLGESKAAATPAGA